MILPTSDSTTAITAGGGGGGAAGGVVTVAAVERIIWPVAETAKHFAYAKVS